MKNCNKKITNTCGGTKNYAPCVYYELDLPDFSTIEEDCVTLEDTTFEVYNLIKDIREQLDLSDLGDDCLTYTLDSENRIVVKNALLKIEEKYCELEEKVTTLENRNICDMPINDCIDLGTLVDQCDVAPTTWGELIQLLVDQHQTP